MKVAIKKFAGNPWAKLGQKVAGIRWGPKGPVTSKAEAATETKASAVSTRKTPRFFLVLLKCIVDFLWRICDTVTSWGLTDKGLTQTFDQKRGFDRIVGAIWIPRIASQSLAIFFLNLISQSGCLNLVHFETCQGNSFMGALSAFTWQGPGVSNHWVISPVQESKKVDFVLLAYFALWYLGNYYYNITNKLLGKTVGYWATEIPKSWVGVVATSLGVWKPHLRCAKGQIHGGFQGWLSQNILVKFFDWGEVTNHQCIFFKSFCFRTVTVRI